MNAKPHRSNTDFQLRHFIAGSCKTADGAWCALYCQRVDMEVKVAHIEIQRMRREAAHIDAVEIIENPASKPSDVIRAKADMLEQDASLHVWEMNAKAAKDELNTITLLMLELEPLRKFSDMSVLEASEACQREEWRLELQSRAEDYIFSHGAIPAEQLATMRQHPDFITHIIPHIQSLMDVIGKVTSLSMGLSLIPVASTLQIGGNNANV